MKDKINGHKNRTDYFLSEVHKNSRNSCEIFHLLDGSER